MIITWILAALLLLSLVALAIGWQAVKGARDIAALLLLELTVDGRHLITPADIRRYASSGYGVVVTEVGSNLVVELQR